VVAVQGFLSQLQFQVQVVLEDHLQFFLQLHQQVEAEVLVKLKLLLLLLLVVQVQE
tara:strand:- start:324 stop:491 length:168 start_codon:yes stop_codon:yes gene_type:complete